jgi:hypothetical protein
VLLGANDCVVNTFPDPVDCAVIEDTENNGAKAMEDPKVDELRPVHVSRISNLKKQTSYELTHRYRKSKNDLQINFFMILEILLGVSSLLSHGQTIRA